MTGFRGTLWTALVLGALALPIVRAQEETRPAEGEDRVAQEVDRQLRRMQRDLDLSDPQVEQVRQILLDTIGRRNVIDDEERSKLEAILTPDQKTTYEENRNRRGREGGGRFGGAGMTEAFLGRLRGELSLTPEQEKGIEEVVQGAQDEVQELFRQMREGGGEGGAPNWDEVRQKMMDLWTGVSAKIEPLLTEEQKGTYKTLVEEMQNRNPFFRGDRGPGPDGSPPDGGPREDGAPREDGGRRPGRGEESVERRVERALEGLGLSEEETAVVKPMLEELEKLRTDREALEGARQALRTSLEEGATDGEALKAKLAEYRKVREEREAALDAKREELRQLLTLEQEARLVELNVLD